MSKYKGHDEPITKREAGLILDPKLFDSLVRAGKLQSVGKLTEAKTSPTLYGQAAVRDAAMEHRSATLVTEALYRLAAKTLRHGTINPTVTRRQLAALLDSTEVGRLIRAGLIEPVGKLTDTTTAPLIYDAKQVADVLVDIANDHKQRAKDIAAMAKVRVPA